MNRSPVSSWAIYGLYLFALVLVVSPLADLFTTVWPARPLELGWRYGFLGLAAGYLHTPILGLVLATLVAYWTENRGVMKALGAVMAAGAAVLVVVMLVFLLDVMQMRALRPVEDRSAVLVGGVMQELKHGTAALVLGLLGLGALRTASALPSGGRRAPGIVAPSQ